MVLFAMVKNVLIFIFEILVPFNLPGQSYK